MPVALHNPPGFAQLVLQDLGINPTPTKIAFFNFWFANEGNNSGGANGQNNPLNVQGSNPVPYNYTTPQEGAKATADTLKQTNMSIFTNILRRPNPTSLQLATALTQTPWASSHYGATPVTKNGKTVWVGGHLVSSFLPSVPHKPGIGTFLGDVGHYAIHPGAGVEKTAGATAGVVEKPLEKGLKYVLYGGAILGGGMLFVVGLILIAADIGISKARGSKPAQFGSTALSALGKARGTSVEEQIGREHLAREARRQGRSPVIEGEVDKPVKTVKPITDVSKRLRRNKQNDIPY